MPDKLNDAIPAAPPSPKRKGRAKRSTKRIDVDKVHKKLLNVLDRDANRLLDSSYDQPLSKDESTSLTNYLKLIKDLKKMEEDASDHLSDEELETIAYRGISDEDNNSA